MKRMGYKKGTPDMMFFEPRGIYCGLFIEVKADTKPSEDQLKFLREARLKGYKTEVCFSVEEIKSALTNYLGE